MNNQKAVERFQASFCPFGYLDIQRALEVASSLNIRTDELVDIIEETADSIEAKTHQMDIVWCIYDYAYQLARMDIENETNVDICNDAPYHSVNIYSNYLDTQFDCTDEDREALATLIKGIKDKDRTEAVQWLLDELE